MTTLVRQIEDYEIAKGKIVINYVGDDPVEAETLEVDLDKFEEWCAEYDKEYNEARCYTAEHNGLNAVSLFDFQLFQERVLDSDLAEQFLNEKLEENG